MSAVEHYQRNGTLYLLLVQPLRVYLRRLDRVEYYINFCRDAGDDRTH